MSKIKIKTHSSSKKRFKVTGTGKIKRSKAFKRHLLNSKSTKTKRNLRKAAMCAAGDARVIKALIPYK